MGPILERAWSCVPGDVEPLSLYLSISLSIRALTALPVRKVVAVHYVAVVRPWWFLKTG